jgi:hypothetical protein
LKAPLRPALPVLPLLVLAAGAPAQQSILATSSPVNPQLLTVDPTTGAVMGSVPITGEEALFGGLTRDGDELYSIDGYNDPNSDRTFRIDAGTGAGAVVGDTGFNWNFRCVEVHPQSGVLYATRDSALYTIDKGTGAATLVANITGSTLDQFTCFAIDAGGTAYGVDIGGTGLFQLDLGTGALTHLGDLSLSTFVQDAAFDSSGAMWVVLSGGGVYKIDVGAVTSTFEFNSSGWGGLTFTGDAPTGTPICFGDGSGALCGCSNESGAGEGGCLNSLGEAAYLTASGAADTTADSMSLTCEGVRAQPGLFFQGDNAIGGGAGTTFGDGLRCCGQNVVRIQVVVPAPPEPATAQMTELATDHGPAGTIQAGDTLCYQYWYRDPGGSPCGSNFNLSNAVSITWL